MHNLKRSTKPPHAAARGGLSLLLALSLSLTSFPTAPLAAFAEETPAATTETASQEEPSAATLPTTDETASDDAAPAGEASAEDAAKEEAVEAEPAAAARAAAPAEDVTVEKDAAADPATLTELWVSSTGSDDNDGSSAAQALATMKKALEVQKANPGITTINLSGDFAGWTNVTIPSGVTLKIAGNTTIAGATNVNGITLANGATLTAGANTLTMTGFNVAIQMNAGAKLTDGTYTISGGNRALNLNGGAIEGSADRSSVVINATGTSGADLQNGSITNATITATATVNGPEQYGLAPMKNASLTTTQTWFYINNGRTFSLDHSDLYINKATAASAYRQAITFANDPTIANGSTLTADGGRISVADGSKSFNVTGGSKIVIKNSIGKDWAGRDGGGLNINSNSANVNFVDSTLETTNIDTFPSYGTRGTSNITFSGNSQVITDHKNKTYDNGGADRSTGGSYVVTGGSFYVTYDPSFNAAVTTPTNGAANGDELLSYFTLADASLNSFNPINKNGERYEYQVANASPDGNKYVFAPAAKVTFKLNNGNAKFADGTTKDKTQSTVRGYQLGFVAGTADVDTPTDSNGVKFLGWFYKDAAGTEHAYDFATTQFDTDTDVYAKWESKTVIYHSGNGVDYIQNVAASESSATALSYDDVVKANPDFAVAGKTFKKWTAASGASSDEIAAGSTLTFTGDTTQIDVYAQFETDTYRVAFSANGGTFGADSVFKKNPDIFTIETDPVLGGEVAVITKGATYNQKLSEVLGSFARGQITPTTAAATKAGSKLGSSTEWNTASDGKGSDLRFDDTTFIIFTTPGANPAFTADTTYYLAWTPDTSTPAMDFKTELPADLWGESEPGQKDSTSALKAEAVAGKTFSLTGAVDVSTIKQQMTAIEGRFPNAKPADIKLTGTASTFTATLTLPAGVVAPKDLAADQVTATGLGDLFEVQSASVNGQEVTVTFGLKKAYTSYEELKAAVGATGTQAAFRMAGTSPIADQITLEIPGFSLDGNAVKNGDELTVAGVVTGTFTSVANTTSDNAVRFNISWNGTQVAAGKDFRAKDDTTIQQTILVKKPLEASLPADMLVYVQPANATEEQQKQVGLDTTKNAPAGVQQGDKINLTGTIDAKTVKTQMAAIEAQFGNPSDLTSIKLSDLSSAFTATFTVPDGLTLPANLSKDTVIPTGFADTFSVSEVSPAADGKSVTVTFALKDGITDYKQLHDAVNLLADTMKLTVPGITVNEDVADGATLTTVGTVSGTFDAVATSAAGTEKDFSFIWTGAQIEDGKDKPAADLSTIQLTLATPNPMGLDLPSDILSGANTEHEEAYPAFAGTSIDLTGAVKIDGIKQQMEAIENQFGNPDGSTIAVDIKGFGFTATMTLPEGMSLPEGLDKAKVTTTDPITGEDTLKNTFEVTDVKAEGQKVTITFGLKDAASLDTYAKLKAAVQASGVTEGENSWLKITVPGVKIADTVADNAKLTTVGTVEGFFKANATSAAGTTKTFSFRWNGTQWADGKDATTSGDDARITFTVQTPVAPQQLALPADILSGGDTEAQSIYAVYPGRTLDLTGAVKIDGIKQQMAAIEQQFGNPDGSSIAIDVKDFGFTATLTVPDGMTLPEDISAGTVVPEGLAETFEITEAKAEGQKVTITFGLKDAAKLDTYAKLKAAVDAAGAENGTWLKVTVPGVTVNDDVQAGQQLVVRGTVDGRFKAIATSAAGTAKAFSFAWTGEQWAEGKDAVAGGDASIRFTAVIPQSIAQELPGDMLTGSDTTHEATPEVAVGSSIDLTGLVKIDAIKQQMAAIEGRLGDPDGSSIKVDVKNFGFTATMTVPEGMTLPADLTKEDVAKAAEGLGDTFEITGVKGEGQKVTITFGLKDAAKLDTYAKLKAAVDAAGVNGGTELKVTVPGIKIAGDLDAGTVLTSTGTVTGEFGAVAMSASGRREVFVFDWTAKQLADGKDALATDDATIQLSVKIAAGTVTVKYVDEQGNEIAGSETLTGAVGAAYSTKAKDIEGYTLKTTPANAEGAFTKAGQTVTYVYTKNPVKAADVTVKYVDEQGNEIAESATLTGNVGEPYKAERKTIDGYEFKQMLEGSAPAEGTLSAEPQTVTFVYAKKAEPVKTGKVIVKYVDEQGNEIAESVTMTGNVGDTYKADQKSIDGYEFKEMLEGSAPAEGAFTEADRTVTFVYAKKSEPGKPGEPGKPAEPQKPGKGGDKKGTSTSKGKVLPKTGDVVGTYMAVLAAAGVSLVAGAYALRRRKQEDAQ
ncbi:MAG: MucBP domain-containing protein [Collinsella sp.]|nr:MucBP domain-containing protein [Collinsella sp.]